ncbi:YopX family protein [Clostridium perfringens]|uniref:YopX family protein n=1 Tax=Clostridium perfringens TaxID=1502 RepID=UPI0028E116C1|nr:YopX family protein [Clostridium perfringens]MDT9337776.1 YopX family protein [Clostridium perfringens]MDT9345533.1 YopX family protein [Clostridium perfringens]MDT9348776.1 YopX family protein [Clostridium perfringens]MDT9354622.1 YopX family protein [Clostridium perfringens]
MSREIKFRAWNLEKKIMVYEDEDDSTIYWDGVYCSDVEMVNIRLRNSEYEWMQYTGLKDKNGKKIYEGDILRCKCLKKCKLDSCAEKVIQYKNSLIEWWESGCNLGYRLRDSKGKTMMIKPTHLNTMEVEVIGNIYENPELLEGER